ncbi:uncharacterized protein EMH_0100400 [Eimeria mitis]|uniref:Uncharacterized protein n=1 Tax=Eimeria mitis TaxID=44415 RepID=U6JTC6_9EIME|nr:uncharacterized protein EMH_0100400 [Eimeria mitis]CDJ27297.1 hypothetical protein EMH_0100400 [Eimeria mitis]
MRNPCEVYTHMAKQIERHCATAAAAAQSPAADKTSAEVSEAQRSRSEAPPPAKLAAATASTAVAGQKSPICGKDVPQDGPAGSPGDTAEQTLQFLHQIVQALSIDLLSAKALRLSAVAAVRFVVACRADDNKMFETLLPTW